MVTWVHQIKSLHWCVHRDVEFVTHPNLWNLHTTKWVHKTEYERKKHTQTRIQALLNSWMPSLYLISWLTITMCYLSLYRLVQGHLSISTNQQNRKHLQPNIFPLKHRKAAYPDPPLLSRSVYCSASVSSPASLVFPLHRLWYVLSKGTTLSVT